MPVDPDLVTLNALITIQMIKNGIGAQMQAQCVYL